MREKTDEEAGHDYLPPRSSRPNRLDYRVRCLELAGGDTYMAEEMFRWLVQSDVIISGPDVSLPVDEKGEEE